MTSTDSPAVDANSPSTPDDQRPSVLIQGLVALLCLLSLATPYLVSSPDREGGSVGNELVYDGRTLITQHEVLSQVPENAGRLGDTLTTTWWGNIAPEQQLYRPLSSFALGLAGAVSGERYDAANPGIAAIPYKLFAIALKIICALLVLQLATTLLGSARLGSIAGLLFATLPVHGEALFDVAGTAELLAAALALGSWSAWLAAGDKPLSKPAALGASLLLLFLAIHAKESAYALPLVFFLADTGRAGSGGFGAGVRHALSKAPALGLAFGVLVVGLLIRTMVVGTLLPANGAIESIDNPLEGAGPLGRVANAMRVLAAGVPTLFGLSPLSSNWTFSADYSATQVTALSPFAWQNLVGVLALVVMLVLPILLWSRCRTRASLVLAYFGSLLIVSNLLFPIGTIFGERLLFFPSVLAVCFVAPFIGRLGSAGLVVAGLIAVGNGYWTHARAEHWKSEADLWEYTADHSATKSVRAKFNNGVAFALSQLFSLAEREFERALELEPDFTRARLALAEIRLQIFDYDGALIPMREVVERQAEADGWTYVKDDGRVPPFTYGALLLQITNIDAKSPRLDPERNLAFLDSLLERGLARPEVHVYRAETLLALGRTEEAETALKAGYDLDSTPLVVETYAELLKRLGRVQESEELYSTWLAGLESDSTDLNAAWFKLKTGELALGRDPSRSFELADDLLTTPEPLPAVVQAEAFFLRARARIEQVPDGDAVGRAQARAESTLDLERGIRTGAARREKAFDAMVELAEILLSQGRRDLAEPYLLNALAVLPTQNLYYRLGRLRRETGRADEALDILRQGVELGLDETGAPTVADAHLPLRLEQIRAIGASSLLDGSERIDAILEAERARGDSAGAQVCAIAYARLQRWSEFDSALIQLRAVAGEEGGPLIDLLGNYGELSQGLRQSPNDVGLLTQIADMSRSMVGALALIYPEMLDAEAGVAALRRAIDLSPSDDSEGLAYRKTLLALLLENTQGPDQAVPVLEEALATPGLPDGLQDLIRGIRDRLQATSV